MKLRKCHFCKTLKFTPYKITEINKEKKIESFNLCKRCGDYYVENHNSNSNKLNLSEIVTAEQLLNFISDLGKNQPNAEKACSCGTSESSFRDDGRFGCSKCYDLFNDKLENLVYPYHGDNHHVGKIPKQQKANQINEDPVEKEKFLKLNYASAIELEDYEKASLIKKQLELLKQPPEATSSDQ